MDCTDIKVLLSGLIDDELDAQTRHAAERHVAECDACRASVDETERVNELVRAEAELVLTPGTLPQGFAGAVLSRTVYDGAPRRSSAPSWMSWVGWFAAAAAVMLALTIWVMDRRQPPPTTMGPSARIAVAPQRPPHSTWRTPGYSFVHEDTAMEPAPAEGGQRIVPAVGAPGDLFFSSIAEEAPTSRIVAPPAAVITRGDVEAIDAAALLLEMLLVADDRSFVDLEEIRRIAEYDVLLPRLAAARGRLGAEDRPAVFAAESVLLRIVNGPISLRDMQELRETVRQCDLSSQLTGITRRGDMMPTL
jgi:hypothetical protein